MQPTVVKHYGIVLLAAGKSSRLGQPKQLLIFDGSSLVKRAAKAALDITEKVIVVTGALSEKVEEELNGLPLRITYNKDFEEGIASSIRSGLTALINSFAEVEGVVFIVCDQPFLSSTIIHELLQKSETTKKTIIASSYSDTLGTPVCFDKRYFKDLLLLTGDSGAKKIFLQYPEDIATISFSLGKIDIDTIQDYTALDQKKFG